MDIQLEIGYRFDVMCQKLEIWTFNWKFIKMLHVMSGSTQIYLSVTQINSTRFHFIGTIELIMCLDFLKFDFKFEGLKIGSLKFWKLRILK